MTQLSPEGQNVVADVSMRHGFSQDAVTHMLLALDQGGSSQAQFNHFEFGGMGQWSNGGMTMIGDMFNNGLKARVDSLCVELSNALMGTQIFQPPMAQSHSFQSQSQGGGMQMQGAGGIGQSSLFVPGPGSGNWWPQELGQPGSLGAQNDLKYAYFPSICRLAILVNGQITVYDTGQHQIGGFGQQQGGDQSLTFSSQFGLVRVADLPIVPAQGQEQRPSDPAPEPMQTSSSVEEVSTAQEPVQEQQAASASVDSDAIFDTIEKLGQLYERDLLTDEEFSQKKSELLARL